MTASMLDAAFRFASQDDWPRVVSSAREVLASDPLEPAAHALLALGLAHLDQPGEAVGAGRQAVALDPEMAFTHYALGHALLEFDDTIGAERAAREALRLQPGADEYGLLAYVYSRQLRWKEALDAAEGGLEDDPNNECCKNFRALALTSLGRTTEATSAVRASLGADPDDAYAHANRGWLLLRASNVEEALDGFRVALRLDPGMEWARLGVIEALKARNPLYRVILRYTLWRGSAGTGTVSILVAVIAFVSNFAYGSYRRDPSLWPMVVPIGVVCGLFIFGPWFLNPLSNLFLRSNRAARVVLTRAESTAATLVGACLTLAAVSGAAFFATGSIAWFVLGTVCVVMLVPIGGAAKAHGTRAWTSLASAALVIGVGGVLAVIVSLVAPDRLAEVVTLLIVATVLWGCLANHALTKYQ
jgi:tetratricopeptide (TPR) repeat protein